MFFNAECTGLCRLNKSPASFEKVNVDFCALTGSPSSAFVALIKQPTEITKSDQLRSVVKVEILAKQFNRFSHSLVYLFSKTKAQNRRCVAFINEKVQCQV